MWMSGDQKAWPNREGSSEGPFKEGLSGQEGASLWGSGPLGPPHSEQTCFWGSSKISANGRVPLPKEFGSLLPRTMALPVPEQRPVEGALLPAGPSRHF